MIDRNIKPGDVTIEYRFDVNLIKSLLNLENGKIVPDEKAITRKGLISEFLSDFIHLPDAFLYYERLVLPRSKVFYAQRLGDEFDRSPIIEKLEKAGILYFPQGNAYAIEEAKQKHKELINLASRDKRVRLLALCEAPDSLLATEWLKQHNLVNEKRSFRRYWAGGADDIVNRVNSIDLDKVYSLMPDNVGNNHILSRREVEGSPGYAVFLTSKIPVIEAVGYYSLDFIFFS